MPKKTYIAGILALSLLVSACASGLKKPEASFAGRRSGRTVVLFVVDGLAVQTLKVGFQKSRLPQLRGFFLRGRSGFTVGRASFPTLTYPNLSSILTARPVGEQPVISNQVVASSGRVVNYEDPAFHPLLRAQIDPLSWIGELGREGRETASFSFLLGMNAHSHMRASVREGLEYERHDYQKLDGRLLDSLERFLRERKPSAWPELIYVHLVGVDGYSHLFGPDSPRVQAYLAWLDSRLAGAFRALADGERAGQSVVTMLTADHGFVTSPRHVPISKWMRKADLGLVLTNEGRFLGLHLPPGRAAHELRPALEKALRVPGVELSALRDGRTLELDNGRVRFRFSLGPAVCHGEPVSLALLDGSSPVTPASKAYRCPSDFDDLRGRYPFLVASLARFLTSPGAPDGLLLAKPDVSFSGESLGGHGGLTAEEAFVPVLLRNASLRGEGIVRTSELLGLLRRSPGAGAP